MRATVIVALVCLLFAAPAFAQQSQERQNMEKKATILLWTGIGVASAGIDPLILGVPSVAVPFLAGGGGLIYYAFHLNSKAKNLPSTRFGVTPMRKGFRLGVVRSW